MDTTYTLPVPQTKSQLRKLIERTQRTQQPIVFTAEETAEPVAVLIQSGVFELLQEHERQLFYLRLQELQRQIDWFEQNNLAESVLQKLIDDFQQTANNLWSVCPKPQKKLCVMFVLAARRLSPDPRIHEQFQVLKVGLELLRMELPEAERIATYPQALFNCGLSPTMGGDNRLSQMYVDIL